MQLKKYWLILPILVALACHLPALRSDFVWDDSTLVKTNGALGSTPILEFYSQDYGVHLGHRNPVGYYRPSFVALLSLIYRIAGPSSLAFHSLSLAVFCGTVVLVSLVTRKAVFRESMIPALLAGCIYAAHSARTEVVGLIMSLPDLVVEACALALLLFAFTQPGKSTARHIAAAAVSVFLISILAVTMKESAFFIIGGIMGCFLLRLIMSRSRAIYSWTVCAAAALAGSAGLYLNHSAGIVRPSLADYVRAVLTAGSGGALHAVALAVRDIVIPEQPVFMHTLTSQSSLPSVLLVILILAFLAGAVFYLCRKAGNGALLFGWLAAGLLSLMFIGAVSVPYSQRYVPVAPAVIGGVLLITRFPHLFEKRIFKFAALFYVALHAAFTLGGTVKCRDNLTFFTFMADENPDLVYPRLYLADRLFHEYRNYELMELHARKGIDIAPASAAAVTLRKFLARKALIDGKPSRAMTILNEASRNVSLLDLPDDAELLWLQAICHLEQGRRSTALPLLKKAVDLEPQNREYADTLNSVTNQPTR